MLCSFVCISQHGAKTIAYRTMVQTRVTFGCCRDANSIAAQIAKYVLPRVDVFSYQGPQIMFVTGCIFGCRTLAHVWFQCGRLINVSSVCSQIGQPFGVYFGFPKPEHPLWSILKLRTWTPEGLTQTHD